MPDPADRHVVAAAIRAKADIILTFNTRDFPTGALAPHGLIVRHPDDFIVDLFDDDPDAICQVARTQRSALTSPPQSAEEFLETLRRVGLTKAAVRLETRRDQL